MPDRHFPAIGGLSRRVQRVAANRPDPLRILANTITMTGVVGLEPYAVLGVLVEGAIQTIVQQVPPERQAETAATLVGLLKERLTACGIDGGDGITCTIGIFVPHDARILSVQINGSLCC